MSYAVKVKSPGDKVWRFMTPSGGETRLRVHAGQVEDLDKAKRIAASVEELNPGVQAKAVDLSKPSRPSRRVREARTRWDEVMALPLTEPREDKLRGPELGSRVRYISTGRRHGQLGTVEQRWYLWAPDTRYGDTRGIVRYDDSVVRFDDGGTLAIDDHDLVEVCPTCGSSEPAPMHGVLGHEVQA